MTQPNGKAANSTACVPDAPAAPATCCAERNTGPRGSDNPLAWFSEMVPHAYEYARNGMGAGKKLVGILCEYTPREVIMAAGAIPVCLCGGSVDMIPPAEEYLPANLCPLIKSTFGYSVDKGNPFLELADLVVGETTCDGKKKMYELLAESRPMHVMELPQTSGDADPLARWIREVEKLKQALETRFDVTVTPEKLREAIRLMNRERAWRRELAELMKADDPPLTGRELLDLKSLISCIPSDLEHYEQAARQLPGRAIDPPARDRTRVLLTGVPHPHGAEWVMDVIEDSGGLIVCQENCTGLKPILEDVDETAENPLQAIAEKYLHLPCSVMTPNDDRLDSIGALAEAYRPQCVIDVIWQACLTYDVESHRVRRFVEDTLGLPYLRIETDYSTSDSARIALRVQALFETAGARQRT